MAAAPELLNLSEIAASDTFPIVSLGSPSERWLLSRYAGSDLANLEPYANAASEAMGERLAALAQARGAATESKSPAPAVLFNRLSKPNSFLIRGYFGSAQITDDAGFYPAGFCTGGDKPKLKPELIPTAEFDKEANGYIVRVPGELPPHVKYLQVQDEALTLKQVAQTKPELVPVILEDAACTSHILRKSLGESYRYGMTVCWGNVGDLGSVKDHAHIHSHHFSEAAKPHALSGLTSMLTEITQRFAGENTAYKPRLYVPGTNDAELIAQVANAGNLVWMRVPATALPEDWSADFQDILDPDASTVGPIDHVYHGREGSTIMTEAEIEMRGDVLVVWEVPDQTNVDARYIRSTTVDWVKAVYAAMEPQEA